MYRMEDEAGCKIVDRPGETRRNHTEGQRLLKQPPLSSWRNPNGIMLGMLVSLLSLGLCVLVTIRTSELQARILSLEQQRDAWMMSLEQVEALIMNRVEQLLEEKLATQMSKTRETRDAPQSCLCPPGPPVSNTRRCI
ncbi:collagen alpha-1(XXV) chain-like [Poeciliopsis prolifica]|uniref:collagen alpha-1(XXV) chain-like n=1 Tax=Poeciliopsis prolifica TaxID=188132 RepID=UPI002413A9B8|nr:collagen alpha-1(XXV) chain-like [Poeciliopsis prolifica]